MVLHHIDQLPRALDLQPLGEPEEHPHQLAVDDDLKLQDDGSVLVLLDYLLAGMEGLGDDIGGVRG